MGVSIWEGNKAERVAAALELIAMNGAGQASAVSLISVMISLHTGSSTRLTTCGRMMRKKVCVLV